ncbi:MAG TPA: helix-turn-helix domain-containing protein [Mycobacteriales bacterium]|nr:helix-turn-helix domain-containing protein [Mycobacteriales bacterium]
MFTQREGVGYLDLDLSTKALTRSGVIMAAERFLTLSDVAEILNISASQTYALVRSGSLPAIKIGGRGQWRVERSQLESYVDRMYDQTRQLLTSPQLDDTPIPQ